MIKFNILYLKIRYENEQKKYEKIKSFKYLTHTTMKKNVLPIARRFHCSYSQKKN